MIGMPYTTEFSQNGNAILKIEPVQLQQVNIFLLYFAVHGMHGAALAAVARYRIGVVLKWRIHQSASWIHNARHAFAAQVEVNWVSKSNGMAIFMRCRS